MGTVERLIYLDELLARSGCSYHVIREEVKAHRLAPARRLGGKLVWLDSEVVAWMERLPTAPPRGRGRPKKGEPEARRRAGT